MTTPTQPLLHNRYRVTTRLGDNRLATVYRATDERLNRSVLVHLLRADLQANEPLRQRFVLEAQGHARRTHPALLEVFDSGEIADRPYMITEDVQGRLLADALPLPLAQALQVIRQIVGAVLTTITTSTPTPPVGSRCILLTTSGRPVLTEPWWLTPSELRLELAHYRAPERALGGPPDERSTVYALGILAYEIISGQRPWTGTDPTAVAHMHVQRVVPSIFDVTSGFLPSLAATIALATARDPATRPPDVQSLARELAAVESSAEVTTRRLVRPVPALRETVREAGRSITRRRSQASEVPAPALAPSASAAPGWSAPPPRPIMPPPQHQQPIAPAPPPKLEQPLSSTDIRKEVQREVRREARRRGCLRLIRRRIVGLVLLAALAGGCWWGVTYGIKWVESGQAKTWACGWLPRWGCDLLPNASPGTSQTGPVRYITSQPVNIRSSPQLDPTNANVIALLAAGTPVTAPDASDVRVSDGIQWLRVETTFENRAVDGWIALDLLQEGSP